MHDDIQDLYHVGYRRLVAQVFAFTTDLNEAQDAVQEAFARALARPRGLRGVDAPEAWLRTVAINVVRRRWRRRQVLNTLLLRERPLARLVQDPPEPEGADLRDALATLPRPYREVIVLHYLADLPVDEVAAILEVPVGTVKSRLSRGREALKGLLDDVEAPPLNEVRQRASKIRTRRRATTAALALVAASALGFFLLRPMPLPPAGHKPGPTPSVAPSYFADGIVIRGIFDPPTAADLPGTITSLDMLTQHEGWLSTSEGTQAHTVDGGESWTIEPRPTGNPVFVAPVGTHITLAWSSERVAVRAGFRDGTPFVYFGPTASFGLDAAHELALPGANGDGMTGTVWPDTAWPGRAGKTIVMTLRGKTISGVYQGDTSGFQRVSDGGDMTIAGEPIVLPDGRLLIADAQGGWQISADLGATWHQTSTGLPKVGSLRATHTGYVALDLFGFGWVAISPDGLTWQKLPIR